ncbi:MAG: DUF1311 domain-containing protein [Alphaproteobacteria bacterium]|nr:DUF1311 domain-containing protein [Alphaproteobacteria bacterium]
MKISRAPLALILLLIAGSAMAQGSDWDFAAKSKEKCSDGSQMQMNDCLRQEYERSDKKLNASYRRLLQLLEDPSALKKAQIAWLSFRDATCAYENSGIGKDGSLYPYGWNACMIDVTNKRIRDLDMYQDWDCNGCPPRK